MVEEKGILLCAVWIRGQAISNNRRDVSAEGYQPLTAELFVSDDPCLDSEAVFGVRESLVVPFVKNDSEAEAGRLNVTAPFYTVDYDFVLEPA